MVAHNQLSVASGDPMLSSGFSRHQVGMWYTDIYADETPIHIK